MKSKVLFICRQCGYESPRWMGRCPDCGEWNTLLEEARKEEAPARRHSANLAKKTNPVQPLADIPMERSERLASGLGELDRLLGGGIVPGSLVLVGGEPGIGKSTLLMQMGQSLASGQHPVLYVSGEESSAQTKMRASRLQAGQGQGLFVLAETDVEVISAEIQKMKPACVVIDSIQSLFHPDVPSVPGSVTQVRECAALLFSLSKGLMVPIFLVGHVTKEGTLAGPRVLEHLVDTVLYFEGDRFLNFRILRVVKNRFGSTNEIGIFEMQEQGLREVTDPSRLLLSQRPRGASGSVIVPALEGSRPFLLEFQALVSPANFPVAQRVSTGVDYNRFCLLLAVLEKKAGLHVQSQDVFVNVTGGFRVTEPAADMGIALAIASSVRDVAVPESLAVFGELGLAGEVRAVTQPEKRISEAGRQGFKRCLLSARQANSLAKKMPCELVGVDTLREAIDLLLKRK